jgi:hypothetical protein
MDLSASRYHGIRTAADFSGIRLTSGSARYGTSIAYFVVPHGSQVRVEGIGEVKARALDAWRAGHEHQARRTQPQQLPADRTKAITDHFRGQVHDLQAQSVRPRAEADAEKNVVNAQMAAERTALLDGQRRANMEIATRRAELDQKIRTVQAGASPGLTKIQEAERDLADHKCITFTRFIGFVLTGRPT